MLDIAFVRLQGRGKWLLEFAVFEFTEIKGSVFALFLVRLERDAAPQVYAHTL